MARSKQNSEYVNDKNYMRSCINIARRGSGCTSENPSVGCVIVKDGVIIARARTSNGGRPHAEAIAIKIAGEKAWGATLYVTLEPCAHHGETPPCVNAILSSGIKRVVIGVQDPDPRTAGQSILKLKNAEIEVQEGVLETECKKLHAGFISRVTKNRPYVTLKVACTLDGKIACANGESQWITGELARRHTHLLRSRNNAILVGANTAIYDDPALTTRLSGFHHNVTRVVLDRKLRIKPNSKLVSTAKKVPILVFHEVGSTKNLEKEGVIIEKTECSDIETILKNLASRGINNLLIEGGAKIYASFFKSGLFDELVIYRAPTILGGDSKPVVSDLNIDTLAKRIDLHHVDTKKLGQDKVEIYKTKRDS